MREILFRGRRSNGEWVEGLPMIYGDCAFICIPGTYTVTITPETLGQYTGLKDRKGQKIFEGDICRNTGTGETVSVKWHGTMAGYIWSKRQPTGYLYDFGELFRAFDKYEVIGNIYDNPELLQEVGQE